MPFPDTTGNRTLAQMTTDILVVLGKENNTTVSTLVQNAIKNAIRGYNAHPWNFNRVTQTVTLQTNTSTYTLTDGFRMAMLAHLLDVTTQRPRDTLEYHDFREFERIYEMQNIDGPPRLYTMRNAYRDGLVQFYPRPGAAENGQLVILHYFRRIPFPTTTFDIPEWAEHMIYWKALAEMQMVVRRDVVLTNYSEQMAREAFRNARFVDGHEAVDWSHGLMTRW